MVPALRVTYSIMLRIELCVPDAEAYEAARAVLGDHPGFVLRNVSIVRATARVLASPGNSFAEMNGGVDGIINTHLSSHLPEQRIERVVKDRVRALHAGELHVGAAVAVRVPGQHPSHDWLVYAPTMRVAEVLPPASINAYLAMRAAILACVQAVPDCPLLACPLFCTGAGGMPVSKACRQMMEAYDTVMTGKLVGRDWRAYHQHHRLLLALA